MTRTPTSGQRVDVEFFDAHCTAAELLEQMSHLLSDMDTLEQRNWSHVGSMREVVSRLRYAKDFLKELQ